MVNGWDKAVDQVAIGWLLLMGCLYITGALLYAVRIPERFFPGKLDIWVRNFIGDVSIYKGCPICPWINLGLHLLRNPGLHINFECSPC